MGVTAVIATSAATTYETNRKTKSAAKRSEKKQDRLHKAEMARQAKADAEQAKQDEALAAARSTGTEAQNRIARERAYMRRSGYGRTGTIKSGRATLG